MNTRSHILYLQFGSKVDETYIKLSRFFSNYQMILVPIRINDLKNYLPKNRENLIVVTKDIQSYKQYRSLLKRFLSYSIRNSKLRVFEVSSFSTYHDVSLVRDEKVISMSLPISMIELARKVIPKVVTEEVGAINKWPGGKRAKLPVS